MITRVGGLAADIPVGWLEAEVSLAGDVEACGRRLGGFVDEPEAASRTAGVARLAASTIHAYGVSGPAARASGIDLDLRRRRPVLAYGELADLLPADARGRAGDAQARLRVLIEELTTSARLVRACAERLTVLRGPVGVRLGKILRLPEGETCLAIEAPLGRAAVFLVSRGAKTPWRLKLRTPSFANVAALESLLVGVRVDQLEPTLASIGYVVGDVDR